MNIEHDGTERILLYFASYTLPPILLYLASYTFLFFSLQVQSDYSMTMVMVLIFNETKFGYQYMFVTLSKYPITDTNCNAVGKIIDTIHSKEIFRIYSKCYVVVDVLFLVDLTNLLIITFIFYFVTFYFAVLLKGRKKVELYIPLCCSIGQPGGKHRFISPQ